MSENVQVGSFYKYLISQGYYFDKELIENFLLSLKVKPFEILTGNSGTGKTKLSQLFAEFIGDGQHEKYVSVRGKLNYSSWSNSAWTLEKESFYNYFPIRECEKKFDMLVDNIPARGNIGLTVQLEYTNEDLKNHLEARCNELGIKKNSKKGPAIDILINCQGIKKIFSEPMPFDGSIVLEQNSNKSAYKDREWTMDHDFYQYSPFKKGKVNCKIIVEGFHSDAKLRVLSKLNFDKNKKLQTYLEKNKGKKVSVELKINEFNFENFKPKWACDDLNRFIIVPVGANWTDNTNILGYHNVITGDYQSPPAYKFINRAQEDPQNPYFLILDEMNLSHVERYFSDFLSAIESGEEIPLYGENKTLKLPDNLFIIGTVNVDETTYMFSPKVLDRANTIEFDTMSARDYMFPNDDLKDFKGNIDYLQNPLKDSDICNLNIEDLKKIFSKITFKGDSLWNILADELTELQAVLKDSGFEFGFRVINEVLRFMVVAWRYEKSPSEWNNWERYFDAQIKQKILPKLHGSEKAIGNVLTNLFNICLVDRNNNENPKNTIINKEDCRYYISALKLKDMAKVLSDQRYVSFIN